MTKNTFISKFMGLSLLICVLSAHIYLPFQQAEKKETVQNQHKDKADDQSDASYSQLSHVVVLPSHEFHFGEFVFKGFLNVLPSVLKQSNTFSEFNSFFQNSYFEKLFELHIAINAP